MIKKREKIDLSLVVSAIWTHFFITQEECFNNDTTLTIQLPKSSEQINLFRLIPSRDEIHKYNIDNNVRNMIRTHDHARSKKNTNDDFERTSLTVRPS